MEVNLFIFNFSMINLLKFFKKIILALSILFILDFLIGSLLRHYFELQNQGIGYHTTHSVKKTEEDILIFGSSRAQHAIIPKIIQDITGLSCYNVGQAGVGIAYSLGLQQMIFQRYQPKVIILEVFPVDLFNKSKKNLDVLSYLLPFYKDYPQIHSIIHERGKYEKFKHYSKIYPFNSLALQILYNNTFIDENEYSKGYSPLHKSLKKNKLEVAVYEKFKISENNLIYLNQFIQNCRSNNIEIYFTYGPIYAENGKVINKPNNLIKKFCEDNRIKLFNFSNNSLFIDNPKYFNDKIHLNNSGAIKYSQMLGLKIKENINN
jgi:hypothetical protein